MCKRAFVCECEREYQSVCRSPPPVQIIKKLIERKQGQIRKVYPGLSCFKDGVRQIPIESIPGIRACARLPSFAPPLPANSPSLI